MCNSTQQTQPDTALATGRRISSSLTLSWWYLSLDWPCDQNLWHFIWLIGFLPRWISHWEENLHNHTFQFNTRVSDVLNGGRLYLTNTPCAHFYCCGKRNATTEIIQPSIYYTSIVLDCPTWMVWFFLLNTELWNSINPFQNVSNHRKSEEFVVYFWQILQFCACGHAAQISGRLTGNSDKWQEKAQNLECQCLAGENGLTLWRRSYWSGRS